MFVFSLGTKRKVQCVDKEINLRVRMERTIAYSMIALKMLKIQVTMYLKMIGDDALIDELIILGSANERGFAIVRVFLWVLISISIFLD